MSTKQTAPQPEDWKTYTVVGHIADHDKAYELVQYDYDTLNGETLFKAQTYAGRYADEQALVEYMAESCIAIAAWRLNHFVQDEYENADLLPPYIPDFQLRVGAILDDIATIARNLRTLAHYELENPQQAVTELEKLEDQADLAALYFDPANDEQE